MAAQFLMSVPTPSLPRPATAIHSSPETFSGTTSDSPGPLGNSPQLDFAVTTLLPASAALLALCFDLLSRISYPKAVQNASLKLSRPFRNFFTLEDVEAPTPCPLHRAPWKARALVAGSAVQSVGWLAVLAYKQEVADWEGSLRAGVAFLAWVRASSDARSDEGSTLY